MPARSVVRPRGAPAAPRPRPMRDPTRARRPTRLRPTAHVPLEPGLASAVASCVDRLGCRWVVRDIRHDRPRTGVSKLQVLDVGFGGLEGNRFDLVGHRCDIELDRLEIVDRRLEVVDGRFGLVRRWFCLVGRRFGLVDDGFGRHRFDLTGDHRLEPLLLRGALLGDEHGLGGKHVSRQRAIGVLRCGFGCEGGAGIGATWQVGRAGILGTGERLGEALGRLARAAASASMRLLVLLLARGLGHRLRLRRPRRRGRAHRQAEIDPGLEQVDPRPERRDLAARLAEGQERLSIALGQVAELGQQLAERRQLALGPVRPRCGRVIGEGRGHRCGRRPGLEEDAHAGLPLRRPREHATGEQLPDALRGHAEDRCRLRDRVSVHHRPLG